MAPLCCIQLRPTTRPRLALLLPRVMTGFVVCSKNTGADVATLPQAEQISAQGIQTVAPGFYAVLLPFANDLRKLHYPPIAAARADAELVSTAERVVKALELPSLSAVLRPNPGASSWSNEVYVRWVRPGGHLVNRLLLRGCYCSAAQVLSRPRGSRVAKRC